MLLCVGLVVTDGMYIVHYSPMLHQVLIKLSAIDCGELF